MSIEEKSLEANDVDDDINSVQDAHYKAYQGEYQRRPGDTLALHPQPVDAKNDPYIYRPEETNVDIVLATLDEFDLYDTLDACASLLPARKEEPNEKPDVLAGSWRASLQNRPPILTSHQDEYFKRSNRALAPGRVAEPPMSARSLHKLQYNTICLDEMEEPEDTGTIPSFGLHPPPKKKNQVYLQHGLKQQRKRIVDGNSVGCVDAGLCNKMAFFSELPACVDVGDANSIDGEDLGEVENEHARKVKEKTWVDSLRGTFQSLAADRDDRVSVLDTLRSEFNGDGDVTGFRWTKPIDIADADKKVKFASENQYSKRPAPDVNAFWYLFHKNH